MKNPSEQVEQYIESINKGIHEAFQLLEQSEVPDITAIEVDVKLMVDAFQFLKLEESLKYKTEVASIIEKIQAIRDGIALVMEGIKDEIKQINKHAAAFKSYAKAANDNA